MRSEKLELKEKKSCSFRFVFLCFFFLFFAFHAVIDFHCAFSPERGRFQVSLPFLYNYKKRVQEQQKKEARQSKKKTLLHSSSK